MLRIIALIIIAYIVVISFDKLTSSRELANEHVASLENTLKNSDKELLLAAIKDSEDFEKHRNIFVKLSQKLIDNGKCTLQHFKDEGGWSRSTIKGQEHLYFLYCGEYDKSNRVYIDVLNEKIQ